MNQTLVNAFVCLMYHEILATEPNGGAADRFSISRDMFARHLDAIVAAGYRGCSLASALAEGRGGPRVALTFDDGSAGQFEFAFPELVIRGMTATFFVTTAWVGQPGFVSWEQLRVMRSAGMSIQSHTHSHAFLSELDPRRLREELTWSKSILDAELAQETSMLAFPGGDHPRPAHRQQILASGYDVVATSRWGTNSFPTHRPCDGVLWVNRCSVGKWLCPQTLVRMLAGDPWIGFRRAVRERTLATIRAMIGPSRYHRWRRFVLDGLRWSA